MKQQIPPLLQQARNNQKESTIFIKNQSHSNHPSIIIINPHSSIIINMSTKLITKPNPMAFPVNPCV
jgi:hypothetical protein